eukprot:1566165-Prymnesium_polylepis.1
MQREGHRAVITALAQGGEWLLSPASIRASSARQGVSRAFDDDVNSRWEAYEPGPQWITARLAEPSLLTRIR